MSLLQRNTSSTSSTSVLPTVPEETSRFILITSKPFTATEQKLLSFLGTYVEYSANMFVGTTELNSVPFDYLSFDANNTDDMTFLQSTIATIQDYVIVISSDDDTETWFTAIQPYITNKIKKLPQGNVNKTVFDNKLLYTIYVPHRRSVFEKILSKITPSCLSLALAPVATVATKT